MLSFFTIFAGVTLYASDIECNQVGYQQTVEGVNKLGQTEYIARHHAVGLYRGSDLNLRSWIPININEADENAALLGIDSAGNVIQFLSFTDKKQQLRHIAIPLSSGTRFERIVLRNDGNLFAIDVTGRFHVYDQSKWDDNPAKGLFTRLMQVWAQSACVMNGLALAGSALEYATTGNITVHYMIASMLGTVGLGMTTATLGARKFEVANEAPNGFRPTVGRLASPIKDMSFKWSEDHTYIQDYEIKTMDRETLSLNELIESLHLDEFLTPKSPADFDVQCKHLLLPKGLNDRSYESHWDQPKNDS